MGLIEIHLDEPEFTFAPFSSSDTPTDTSEPTDDDSSPSENDLHFPNDESESGGSALGGLLALAALVLVVLVVRKLVGGSPDLEDFADDPDE